MLGKRFDEAFAYARHLHRDQVRKGTSIPYVSHLMSVSALVIEHGGSEDQAIAGLLHDAAEDQGGAATLEEIRSRFGPSVADIVADCTDSWSEPKPPWRERKEAYIAALPRKPQSSLLVSLADKTHNAEAILFDYREFGDDLWGRFTGGAEGTRWYYRTLVRVFRRAVPGRLCERLDRAVRLFSLPRRSPGDPDTDPRLAALLAFVQSEGRVCPVQWGTMWDMLPGRQDAGAPALPLILGGWGSSDEEKIERLRDHIIYAAKKGVLARVEGFLRGLPADGWNRRRVWTASDT